MGIVQSIFAALSITLLIFSIVTGVYLAAPLLLIATATAFYSKRT